MKVSCYSCWVGGLLIGLGFFLSCSKPDAQASQASASVKVEEEVAAVVEEPSTIVEPSPPAPTLPLEDQLTAKGKAVLTAFAEEDMATLASMIHPERGITFSPIVYVSKQDRHFSKRDIELMAANKQTYNWGNEDGSGKALTMTFKGYCDRYVYDADFLGTDSVYIDRHFQRGNAINNARKAYKGCHMIEYYVPGVNPDYGGLDWRALRLIFEPFEGEQYLTGIIHAEWTP